MEARAIAKYVRTPSTKVGVVLDLIRGKNIQGTSIISQYTSKDAAVVINKVLKSAVANTESNHETDIERLHAVEAFVSVGPTLRKLRSMDRGKAFRISKRTSNTILVAKERAQKEGGKSSESKSTSSWT